MSSRHGAAPRIGLVSLLLALALLAAPARALASAGNPVVLTDDVLAPGKFFKALDRISIAGEPEQLTAAEALRVGAGLAFSGPEAIVTVGPQSVSRFDLASSELTTVAAPTAGDMRGVALAPDGGLVATDLGQSSGTAADGRIVRIDPLTGAAATVSAQGALVNPLGIVVAEDGAIYVTNSDGEGHGDVVKVDPVSGEQEALPANPNPLVAPWGIAFLPDGELVVADESYNHAFRGALVRIDPATGRQTPLLLEGLGGPSSRIDGATAVAVDTAGEVLVTERSSGQVDRVDLQSGDAQQIGQNVASPIGIDVEPGQAPTTRLLSGPSGRTRSTTPTFAFEPSQYGAQSSCEIDREAAVPCRRAFTSGELAPGEHSFSVRSSRFGFTGPAAVRDFIVDPSAPDTLIDSGPSGPSGDSTPSFSFEAPGGGTTFTCAVDGEPRISCESPFTTGELADGSHSFNVRADNDPVGDTRSFTVDTRPPQTSIGSGPGEGAATNRTQPVFTFAADEDPVTFACLLDGAAAPCAAVFSPALPLDEGPHLLTVAAVDGVGNAGAPLMRHFVVDVTPPRTTITAGPSGETSDATPSFAFAASEAGGSFRCSIDGADLLPCSSPFTASPPLPDGAHVFNVQATDAAGNVEAAPARRIFRVVEERPTPLPAPEPLPTPQPPVATTQQPPIATKLRLRAFLTRRSLHVSASLIPGGTGRIELTVRARADQRLLVRHLTIVLKEHGGSLSLAVPPGFARARIVARYSGDGSFSACSAAATVRAPRP